MHKFYQPFHEYSIPDQGVASVSNRRHVEVYKIFFSSNIGSLKNNLESFLLDFPSLNIDQQQFWFNPQPKFLVAVIQIITGYILVVLLSYKITIVLEIQAFNSP